MEPGYRSGSNVLHVTRTLLVTTALCGEYVDMIGVPDNAVACEDCDRVGMEQGIPIEAAANSIALAAGRSS